MVFFCNHFRCFFASFFFWKYGPKIGVSIIHGRALYTGKINRVIQASPHYVYMLSRRPRDNCVFQAPLTPKPEPKLPQILVELKGQVSETMSIVPKDPAEPDLPSPQPEHSKDILTTVQQPTTVQQTVLPPSDRSRNPVSTWSLMEGSNVV